MKQIKKPKAKQITLIEKEMSNGKSLAYVANAAKQPLKLQEIDLPPLEDDGVEIKVNYW